MKLEAGKGSYLIQVPVGEVLHVTLRGPGWHEGHVLMLARATLADVIARRGDGKLRDMPENYALNGRWMEFSPVPDKAYDCTVRYYPPAMEL